MEGIEKAKKKFGITEDITVEKVEKLKKEFPWIEEIRKKKEE